MTGPIDKGIPQQHQDQSHGGDQESGVGIAGRSSTAIRVLIEPGTIPNTNTALRPKVDPKPKAVAHKLGATRHPDPLDVVAVTTFDPSGGPGVKVVWARKATVTVGPLLRAYRTGRATNPTADHFAQRSKVAAIEDPHA